MNERIEELMSIICEGQNSIQRKEVENYINNLQSKIDKAIEYINKHCVNEKISKEVGYKCYTMADTNELEKIMNILGDDKQCQN